MYEEKTLAEAYKELCSVGIFVTPNDDLSISLKLMCIRNLVKIDIDCLSGLHVIKLRGC